MVRTVSAERKAAHYGGIALIALGLLIFVLSVFRTREPFTNGPDSPFLRPLLGIALVIGGKVLSRVGARGLAGSGVVLDPERAREDLEPYARMAGGLAKDALDEAGLARQAKQVVMLECAHCKRRNEADARFCQGCGRAL
ncbi:MAG: zinc ribbon domain-containing protein [Planctomycetes bacterium]|nr:zinc ribbon domain-containing protein [Planctomycetota bacterium]